MRVTLINTHDLVGGAARCSYDLARSLNQQRDEVSLVVGGKSGEDPFVSQIRYRYLDYKARGFFFNWLGITDVTLAAPLYNCFRWPQLKTADVFNVHNLHGAYWNLAALPILARRAPIVITLHDEWLLTGDCAYTYDCDRWQQTCGRCPQATLESYVSRYAIGGRDSTRANMLIKQFIMNRLPADSVVIVTPSDWLGKRVKKSPHLRRFEHCRIPYGVDLDTYRPLPQREARESLGLPADQRLVFASAVDLADPRKNFTLIDDLLTSGQLPENTTVVLAGAVGDDVRARLKDAPVRFLGYISEDEEVARVISACDCTLLLSRADNLPFVGIESLACGRPLIASSIGGIPELVAEGVTGWLVSSHPTIDEVATTLRRALTDRERLRRMSTAARSYAEEQYSLPVSVAHYRELFSRLERRWKDLS